MAEALDLDRPAGALVNDTTVDGSADRAGIEPGDVILEFNDVAVETWNDLPPLVGANPPGTKATVKISRAGKVKTFDVTLDALDGDDQTVLAGGSSGAQTDNALFAQPLQSRLQALLCQSTLMTIGVIEFDSLHNFLALMPLRNQR